MQHPTKISTAYAKSMTTYEFIQLGHILITDEPITLQDMQDSGSFRKAIEYRGPAYPIQVTEEVFDEFVTSMPTIPLAQLNFMAPPYATTDGGFANSEPASHNYQGQPVYATFGRNLTHGRKFYFLGYFPGKTQK